VRAAAPPDPFDLALRDGALILALGGPRRLLSSAPWRGGLVRSRWWLNHHVRLDFCEDDVDAWIGRRLRELSLPPGETTACLTAAYVENHGRGSETSGPVRAHSVVTAGLSNLSSAGLTPPWRRDGAGHTINACVLLEASLPDAALVELVQIVTETKSRLLSGMTTAAGDPATGTSTDTVTVVELGGPAVHYAGAVTDAGHAAARAFEMAFLSAHNNRQVD
jgi:adenosylcobinamide amidohydrolase